MAKYKVLTRYKDKVIGKILEVGDEVDMTVKRANEVNKKGQPQDGILERIDNKQVVAVSDLELLKKHCKIDHSYEDDLLIMYYDWAKQDIADAVTDDLDWLEKQTLYRAAVFPLTAYYFENRLAYTERNLNYAPHMVLSVVHKLRDAYAVQSEQIK